LTGFTGGNVLWGGMTAAIVNEEGPEEGPQLRLRLFLDVNRVQSDIFDVCDIDTREF